MSLGIAPVHLPFFTDSYKIGHWKQYPSDTEKIYSYFEARDGAMFPHTMFFGLQALLRTYLTGQVVTKENVRIARERAEMHFGRDDLFNYDGWMHIVNNHGGYLPVEIKAVLEGTVVPNRNVLMTIENTDERVPWLTNWLETFLVQVWYPCTVATLSMEVKKIILKYLEATGDPSLVNFKLHDFGYRGSTSIESAGIGGMAHLVNFLGTDTLRGVEYAREFYGESMAGFSIPASEHSTITAWGKEFEGAAFKNMLEKHPTGLVACVSDSYDIYNAIRNLWGHKLKKMVMEREGCLVIRPDSGDPKTVVRECCDLIWEAFGGTVNAKGYKVFNEHVRLIQGDGIGWYKEEYPEHVMGKLAGPPTYRHTVEDILEEMMSAGYSADNIAFGSGGGLLQQMDRDTQKVAFKCSAMKRLGQWHDVWKDPVTSHGKRSKKGKLKLVRIADVGGWASPQQEDLLFEGYPDLLQTVYRDGTLRVHQTFGEVRERAADGVRLLALT